MKKNWLWILLIVLLVMAIFVYKTKIEDQLIKDKSSQELNLEGLSSVWLWVVIGLGVITVLVIILMFLRSPY